MTPDSFRDAHRGFTRRRPFVPFIVEFHSGRRLLIPHPEAIVFRKSVIHFLSPGPRAKNYAFDSSSVSLLCELEEGDPTSPQ